MTNFVYIATSLDGFIALRGDRSCVRYYQSNRRS
jgi:hypothetical protein